MGTYRREGLFEEAQCEDLRYRVKLNLRSLFSFEKRPV